MVQRLAVASRSRFELLPQDEIVHSESDEDEGIQLDPVITKSELALSIHAATRIPDIDGTAIEAEPPANAALSSEAAATLQGGLTEEALASSVASTLDRVSDAKVIIPKTASDTDIRQSSMRAPLDADSYSPPNLGKGVKFQDGLSPGEGNDGETIIPGLDRHIGVRDQKGLSPIAHVKEDSKHRNLIERTTWTFIMIAGFIILLCMGHPYMILLVMLCQTLVYKEVTALFELSNHDDSKGGTAGSFVKRERWNKTLNWYFFVVTNYFLYGESIIYYFKHVVFVDALFLPFARNHRFISFMLYVFGFMAFVVNLQKQYLRQQFALFCWVHMTLLVIVVSSHFIVNNILEGLIWFFVPASLVICNDVMAYVCGKLFGRTPLIKLSPKKTVEGFVGAFFCTLLFALIWGSWLMRYNYMICPAHDLGVNAFSDVRCESNPVFLWQQFSWPGLLNDTLELTLGFRLPNVPYTPYHLHLLVMATFASLAAPFGGFFASGFKRAFDIKDFGHSIPGHGGMTDRMDCQFMMGLFAYVYYSSIIRVHHVSVGQVIQTIVNSLSVDEQLEVFQDLQRYLKGQGIDVTNTAR